MWSGVGYSECLQKGNGNFHDSDESDLSQESSEVSQTSQETDSCQEVSSSQEVTEHLDPWSRIQDEVEKRHEAQLNALINEYEENGDQNNVARVKAENALLPVYRKELRKVLLEYLQWMRAMKKDSTFRKVMETFLKKRGTPLAEV